ncbi:MAG: DUF4124 domain-containing protein [Cellvibrionaceae bacterium]
MYTFSLSLLIKTALSLAMSLALTTTAFAEIYRWTGENGKVHFGDKPPSSAKTESVDTSHTNSDSSASTHRQINEIRNKERQATENHEKQQQTKEQFKKAKLNRACKKARKHLGILQRPVYFTNEDGSETKITEKERQAMADKFQKMIQKHCK